MAFPAQPKICKQRLLHPSCGPLPMDLTVSSLGTEPNGTPGPAPGSANVIPAPASTPPGLLAPGFLFPLLMMGGGWSGLDPAAWSWPAGLAGFFLFTPHSPLSSEDPGVGVGVGARAHRDFLLGSVKATLENGSAAPHSTAKAPASHMVPLPASHRVSEGVHMWSPLPPGQEQLSMSDGHPSFGRQGARHFPERATPTHQDVSLK